MAADYAFSTNDKLPILQATVTDGSGAAVNVTGGTVVLRVRSQVRGSSWTSYSGSVTTGGGASGLIEYTPAGTEDFLVTAGTYYCQWVVTLAAKPFHVPNNRYMTIRTITGAS